MTSQQERWPDDETDFDIRSCMAMMEKLVSEHRESCDCAQMMSHISGQESIPADWMSVMRQMMEFHFGKREGGSQ